MPLSSPLSSPPYLFKHFLNCLLHEEQFTYCIRNRQYCIYKFRNPTSSGTIQIQTLKFYFTNQSCYHLGVRIWHPTERSANQCKKLVNVVKMLEKLRAIQTNLTRLERLSTIGLHSFVSKEPPASLATAYHRFYRPNAKYSTVVEKSLLLNDFSEVPYNK